MISSERFNVLEISSEQKYIFFSYSHLFLFLLRFYLLFPPYYVARIIFIRIYLRTESMLDDRFLFTLATSSPRLNFSRLSFDNCHIPLPPGKLRFCLARLARNPLLLSPSPVDSRSSRLWNLIARVNSAHAVFSQPDWRIANYEITVRIPDYKNFSEQNINDIIDTIRKSRIYIEKIYMIKMKRYLVRRLN